MPADAWLRARLVASGNANRLRPDRASTPKRVWAAAVGKAACAMVLGAHDALGRLARTRAADHQRRSRDAPQAHAMRGVEVIESSHPMPDQRSLAAGERLLQWVDEMPADVEPLFLISGGASALVESLVPGATFCAAHGAQCEGTLERHGHRSAQRPARAALADQGRAAGCARLREARPGSTIARDGATSSRMCRGMIQPSSVPASWGPSAGSNGADDGIDRTVVASIDHAVERVRVEANASRTHRATKTPARSMGRRIAWPSASRTSCTWA